MQRASTNTVTQAIPVLVPCNPEEQDGLATFLIEFASPQPVRVVTDADFKGPRKLKEALSTKWDEEREQFKAVMALLTSLSTQDRLAIDRARQHVGQALALKREREGKLGITPAKEDDREFGRILIQLFGLEPGQEKEAIERWNGYALGPRAKADHRWLLSQLMSQALDSVRLVLWWSGKQFRPALYCPNLKSAVYTFLLISIVTGRGWGMCPHCGEFFIQKRSDQNYCTIAHREAHRVARWRAAKVHQLRKKGGRNGSRKTR